MTLVIDLSCIMIIFYKYNFIKFKLQIRIESQSEQVKRARYEKTWKFVIEKNELTPGLMENLHMFNLGHIKHYYFSNKAKRNCYGCDAQQETLLHPFKRCSFSNELSNGIGFGRILCSPFSLKGLTTPAEHTTNVKIMRRMSIYTEVLIKSRGLRRNGLSSREAITATKFQMKIAERKYGFGSYV
ncbi:hypothetical protein BN7_4715 [Wickerhamomyces ciferrii]|uniref:Uncharacterized protein n=1 Tax=Wickerhamomyces ciferrii (strain ATCC 14091 / BCRC 22168 / CBS 111 / JCM 3599 / NBRC 0793 / NRRL Y-1031 F-60-10) TaxID=1206466 RepID=K0KQ15_WICCF|nr:uncharacterized protein BN7_4715 [Wickerhamomyces ciferrii]CCH45136.1 hypothetical protein BN7_4715 [Wickerhamomyces ciferrii]